MDQPMSVNETIESSTVHRLAKKLERDMHVKNLSPGDPYLSATQAARTLGVSRSVADRALLLLAKRDLLVRRAGQGTLVGSAMRVDPAMEVPRMKQLQSVFLLEGPIATKTALIPPEMMLPQARHRFNQSAVHAVYLPQENTVEYVKQLVARGRSGGGRVGLIAKSCTRPVYDYFAECRVPTVVLGTLYADQREALPSIDLDYYEAGRLMVNSLAGRGHRRLGLFAGPAGRAGTENFINGILAGTHPAGISPAGLVMKFYPGSDKGFAAEARSVLAAPDHPTALLTQSETSAKWLSSFAAELGLSVPGDLDVSCVATESEGPVHCPCVRPQHSVDEIIAQAVEMLWRVMESVPLEEHTVAIPVSLCEAG
jgi:DNA-binding LacI/PurR family transcriptional regulator